jgi:hypothetical protein
VIHTVLSAADAGLLQVLYAGGAESDVLFDGFPLVATLPPAH